ncbi:hypothetical protein Csa_012237 [Cucumis sativus]|uniref:Uncharacterized protein n=1 Tax=Cucumis sativus TaxID=3659 RepID=A0A0A0L0W1_CUCSA|nr:hypothetical protein Csa_012237 [Cucumis sativus]
MCDDGKSKNTRTLSQTLIDRLGKSHTHSKHYLAKAHHQISTFFAFTTICFSKHSSSTPTSSTLFHSPLSSSGIYNSSNSNSKTLFNVMWHAPTD